MTKADAKVRTITKEKRDQRRYFQVYGRSNEARVGILGKELTQAKAVQRLRSGFDIITWYRKDAKSAAAMAGGMEPVLNGRHENLSGHYRHYHLGKYLGEVHNFFWE